MTFLAFLKKVLKLVNRGWIQGDGARDEWRRSCDVMSDKAVAWCITGAAVRATAPHRAPDDVRRRLILEFYARFITELMSRGLIEQDIERLPRGCGRDALMVVWNDGSTATKERVVDIMETLIAREEAEV